MTQLEVAKTKMQKQLRKSKLLRRPKAPQSLLVQAVQPVKSIQHSVLTTAEYPNNMVCQDVRTQYVLPGLGTILI